MMMKRYEIECHFIELNYQEKFAKADHFEGAWSAVSRPEDVSLHCKITFNYDNMEGANEHIFLFVLSIPYHWIC